MCCCPTCLYLKRLGVLKLWPSLLYMSLCYVVYTIHLKSKITEPDRLTVLKTKWIGISVEGVVNNPLVTTSYFKNSKEHFVPSCSLLLQQCSCSTFKCIFIYIPWINESCSEMWRDTILLCFKDIEAKPFSFMWFLDLYLAFGIMETRSILYILCTSC